MNREEKVAVFNQIMGQQIGEDPTQVPLKLRQLGIKLIFEELHELAIASGCEKTFMNLSDKLIVETLDKFGGVEMSEEEREQRFNEMCEERGITDTGIVDEVEQLDALEDVQYTTSWSVNVFGHSKHFEPGFLEVCRSNDSKACSTIEEAEKTKEHWEKEAPKEAPFKIDTVSYAGKKYYVVKNCHDKVKKSISYLPANFKQFFIKK